jgi:ubiquitin carboxyl-terminal hydrolase 5/13
MGFSVEGCKRALINTGNNSVETAMNWVFEHQGDADFDTPYQAPSKKARRDASEASGVRVHIEACRCMFPIENAF